MPEITYISADGERTVVQGRPGQSVMEAAVGEGLEGITAECGGNLMCATCHVYVDDDWTGRVGDADEAEEEMLEETVSPRRPNSRLSCQIRISDELDGLVVHTPEAQE